MISFAEAIHSASSFDFPVGEAKSGSLVCADVRDFPHLLVAGMPGSGKSAFLHTLVSSLISHNKPEKLRLILCDTRIIELSIYNGVPHLLIPVVINPKQISSALAWAKGECERRLKLMSEANARSFDAYNERAWQEFSKEASRVLIIVDDFSQVLLSAPEAADSMQSILQNGRIAGVHLIAVTQTPLWKPAKKISSNFRSKIMFSSSLSETRQMLDTNHTTIPTCPGDALFSNSGAVPVPVHTVILTNSELKEIIALIKKDITSNYSEEIMEEIAKHASDINLQSSVSAYSIPESSGSDELLPAAVEVVLETGQASVSTLQRRLKLGYARAARIVDEMENCGIVGPFEGAKPRKVLITKGQWEQIQNGTFVHVTPTIEEGIL